MGEATGIYFPGRNKAEVNEIRRRLSELAAELGYITTGGANKGKGSVGLLLAAVAHSEVSVTRQT
jgi:hypothetical protein